MAEKPDERINPDNQQNDLGNEEAPDVDMQVRPYSATNKGCGSVILLTFVITVAFLTAFR